MMLDICRHAIAWHVVYTAPQGEVTARNGIRAIGFDTYLPLERTTKIQRRRRVELERPLFSRYVFVGVRIQDDWQDLKRVDGVESVLCNNDLPSRVPQAFIEKLRHMEVMGSFDFRRGAAPFQIGERVKVSDGPFAGLHAVIEGFTEKLRNVKASRRAKVLLDFLGRQTAMEMDVMALEKA